MTRIFAEGLSFAFSERAPLFDHASFVLVPGFTGLVGANGAGKSTLLRLISGQIRPGAGRVRFEPERPLIALADQAVETPGDDVRRLASSDDARAGRFRSELALDPDKPWARSSPGERKRWQLAAALARAPDVLLLDEPTNHLDFEARAWLLVELKRHRGIALVVSHDRDLLAELTSRTLRVHRGRAELFEGAYAEARQTWEATRVAASDARARARGRVRVLGERLHAARSVQRGASAARSAGKRMKSRHDSDARSAGARTLADWADSTHGRKVTVLRRELDEARASIGEHELEKPLGGAIFAEYRPAPMPLLAVREAGALVVGDRSLFDAPALVVRRGDRIWISGPNGVGKTTLIHELRATLRLTPEQVVWLPQDLSEAAALAALREVRELPREQRGRVLSVVAALGVDPDRLLASARPSPGEARKLVIASGLGKLARLIVLDEPTNHLDLPSIERLEAALVVYPGALLIATHDEQLAGRTTRTRWQLSPRGVVVSDVSGAIASFSTKW